MEISQAIDAFTHYLQFEKRFSDHTILAYSGDLQNLQAFLEKEYSVTDLTAVDGAILRSWVVLLMEQGQSARSVARKITTLRSFYRFHIRQGNVQQNPVLRLTAPKIPKRLPVFVEKEQMNLLLDTDTFSEGYSGLLEQLIIQLFYGTGMRLAELISLRTVDVDLALSQLKVTGKRNKQRIIPFNNELAETLKRYIAQRPAASANELLVSESGDKLYPSFVYRLVKKQLSKVTTLKKKSPHVLRHTFATDMLNNGAELNAIKDLLGHASLAATQVYTHTTVEKLKNIHKQAHPKA